MQKENPETAESRKKDHIDLAFRSQVESADHRFYYEPLFAPHPEGNIPTTHFAGRDLQLPLWVSSMTGGTQLAGTINHNLARACAEFGMGMGLGSCRIILWDDEYLPDFDLRPIIGDGLPFYANLGIAQLEQLILDGDISPAIRLVEKLRADGLIIHVNPLQEALQPEGDRYVMSSLEVIDHFLHHFPFPLIVKEVGQGMGMASLQALMERPLKAIEFAAHGGTNFALLELLRHDESYRENFEPLVHVGHSAAEMVDMVNHIARTQNNIRCQHVIISGGIRNFLDGYYLVQKSEMTAVYGQASAFLKHARGTYDELQKYVKAQVQGLELAHAYLRVK